jgi:hypothetical protein
MTAKANKVCKDLIACPRCKNKRGVEVVDVKSKSGNKPMPPMNPPCIISFRCGTCLLRYSRILDEVEEPTDIDKFENLPVEVTDN